MQRLPKLISIFAVTGALVLAQNAAHAAVITISQCWSSCTNVGAGNQNTTVATLELVEVMDTTPSVTFMLTNMVSNLGLGTFATSGTILTQLDFSYSGTEDLSSSVSPGIVSGPATVNSFTFGPLTNAGLSFKLALDLAPPPGNGDALFTDGETLAWTIPGVTETEFLTPPAGQDHVALVHIQRLANGGSVKYVDGVGGNGTAPIPEPGTLLLIGSGLVGLGARARKQRNSKRRSS